LYPHSVSGGKVGVFQLDTPSLASVRSEQTLVAARGTRESGVGVMNKLVCANWKMHKTLSECRSYFEAFDEQGDETTEVVVFPPQLFLHAAVEAVAGRSIGIGAQCCHHEPEGAFTGAVSCEMVASVGASWVLCGHSERRWVFSEPDEDINLQVQAALGTDLRAILCVGEKLGDRESGRTFAVVSQQLTLGLFGLSSADAAGLAIAYEPVWAIGTGRTATSAQAQEVHHFVRQTLSERFSDELGARIPILYGGSVKRKNAAELLSQRDVNGVLVGGASLDPEHFAAIVGAARVAPTGG
jgi:triosephosphate isomerase